MKCFYKTIISEKQGLSRPLSGCLIKRPYFETEKSTDSDGLAPVYPTTCFWKNSVSRTRNSYDIRRANPLCGLIDCQQVYIRAIAGDNKMAGSKDLHVFILHFDSFKLFLNGITTTIFI